jgi:hypothetical protein
VGQPLHNVQSLTLTARFTTSNSSICPKPSYNVFLFPRCSSCFRPQSLIPLFNFSCIHCLFSDVCPLGSPCITQSFACFFCCLFLTMDPSLHFTQPTPSSLAVLRLTPQYGPHTKDRSSAAIHGLVMAIVFCVSQSLPSNGSTQLYLSLGDLFHLIMKIKFCMYILSVCYISHISYPPLFDYPNIIWEECKL